MKNLREWREGIEEHSDPNTLLDRLNTLAQQAQVELESFIGDRPEGFLDVIGAVKELKRRIVEIEMGIAGDRPHFQTEARKPAPNQISLFDKKKEEPKKDGWQLASDYLNKKVGQQARADAAAKLQAKEWNEDDEEMDDETVECPACGSPNGRDSVLGKLGDLTHYRCRRCGSVYSPNTPSQRLNPAR